MIGLGVLIFLSLLLSSFGLLAQTPTRKPTLEVEYDRERDFSKYESYAWSKSQEPATRGADHIRVVKAVAEKMEERGFHIDTMRPSVWIRYRLEKRSKVQSSSAQKESVWDPTDLETRVRVERYKEGSLSLEIVDAATNIILWRAQCTHIQGTPDKAEQEINETVARLFTEYPNANEPDY